MFKRQGLMFFIKSQHPVFFLIILILQLVPLTCLSANSDKQVWTNITAIGPINKKHHAIRYWLEIQNRFSEESDLLSQQLLRPGLGYALSQNLSVWLGYANIYTSLPFVQPAVNENRIWQQMIWTKKYTKLRITARSRLEERYIERVPETAWRYRQLLKTSIYIPNHPTWELVAIDEGFFHLNSFNLQRNQGFDQNRFFVGLGYRVNEKTTIEAGYLNQFIKRTQNDNYTGNYLALTLLLT